MQRERMMNTRDDKNGGEDDGCFDHEVATPRSSLLTCSFNQDGGCLAIGTTAGFSVHNLHPHYAVSVNHDHLNGIGLVELLFRCNIMLLVGGGPNPYAPPHRVLIWDDHVPKAIGELSFRQSVLRVRLRKDAVAVALRDRCYVYDLGSLTLRDKIYTDDNPHGLLCLSTQVQDMVLACPSVTTGHVRVELYGLRKTVLMEAHEGALRALSLTADGSKLATASEKGTVIRVFDVASATCLHEFRRGFERATITCLAWSWDYSWLACTSDKGTSHVFQLLDSSKEDEKKSNDTATSLTRMIFSSVRKSVEGDAKKSVCQVRGVPHPQACAFVGEASNLQLAVAGWDADGNGVLLISEVAAGEEPKRVGYHVLCRSEVSTSNETEEARRRRRMRGWTPEVPATPEGGRLYVGERLDLLERGMEQICFEEDSDDDEFVSVSTVQSPVADKLKQNAPGVAPPRQTSANNKNRKEAPLTSATSDLSPPRASVNYEDSTSNDENRSQQFRDSGTIGDSVRTETLDEDEPEHVEAPT